MTSKRSRSIVIVVGAAVALAASCPSCKPDLGARESLITDTRILAVRGVPPEVPPGEAVRFDLLVATPSGPIDKPVASWGFCSSAKLLTENGAASAACLQQGGVRPLADGPSAIEVAMPINACSLFGPDISSADFRPRDPDITGGFYQPLRVTVFDRNTIVQAFGLERIRCTIAAGAQIATEFGKSYSANNNPELLPLTADVPLDQPIPRSRRIVLRASWPATSAETFALYDVAEQRLVNRRESLRASWFATAGAFDADRTGREESDLETFTENGWTAPYDAARTVHVYVVLRDARGGVAFTTKDLTLQ